MGRCKNCQGTNKKPYAKCWRNWGLCGECAKRLHATEYGRKDKERNKLVKILYRRKSARVRCFLRLQKLDKEIEELEKKYYAYLKAVAKITT